MKIEKSYIIKLVLNIISIVVAFIIYMLGEESFIIIIIWICLFLFCLLFFKVIELKKMKTKGDK